MLRRATWLRNHTYTGNLPLRKSFELFCLVLVFYLAFIGFYLAFIFHRMYAQTVRSTASRAATWVTTRARVTVYERPVGVRRSTAPRVFGVALVSAVRLLSRGSGARRSGLACVHPAELDIGCSVRLGPAVVGRSPVVPVSSFSDRTTVHNQIGTILCQWQQVLGKGEEWLIITLLLLSQIYISALAMNRRRLR